ncbi:MAG: glucan 1,4-alpha-glucosidase [Acidobacteriota bacterium]
MSEPPLPFAPGWPGIPPRWTSSAKTGVGTALQFNSRVWFTLSHGITNEVYYPRLDRACIRDLGLIITDGREFVSEEKRDTASTSAWVAPGVPAYHLVNTHRGGRYRIEKDILSDPRRETILQQVQFTPLSGTLADYQVFVLLAPHLANRGWGNTAWVGDHKGVPMLFAERHGTALAVACTPAWTAGSAGFVGVSDGWQELAANKTLRTRYLRAENGNVALTGAVDLTEGRGAFLVALAFGSSPMEAGHRAHASLLDGFAAARASYVSAWTAWQDQLRSIDGVGFDDGRFARTSAAVIRCHEEKHIPGALIASLSIPWGAEKGDEDLGGYHLVWPRDLVEAAGGLLAVGAADSARRILDYLRATQEADGSWSQNMWVDGEPYWHGIQLDETAFPVLLVDLLHREGHLDAAGVCAVWPMVRRAVRFIVRNGPVTEQDRWEENAGLSPFTVAVQIAALLVAAGLAEHGAEPAIAPYLRETADAWNETIDRWVYVRGTGLARDAGVDGYYVRIAPPETADAASPAEGFVPIKNRPWLQSHAPATQIVSPDALALVRFGLRAPDDPRILNTVRVIDHFLKFESAAGPVWRRYNGDGYGEHEDGSAFDGEGIGRPWPLLTGERAHYELAAGRPHEAARLLATMEACASDGGLLPEQIWDDADVPERELFAGRPSGSAMPLVWAHAEYLKLRRSLRDGRIFDLPPQTWQRYVATRTRPAHACWRFNHKLETMLFGRVLRIETLVPAVVRWSTDDWADTRETEARDTGLDEYVTDLPTETLLPGTVVVFTFYWPEAGRWEGVDFRVVVETKAPE